MKATALFIAILGLALLMLPMIALNLEQGEAPLAGAQVHAPNLPGKGTPENPLPDAVAQTDREEGAQEVPRPAPVPEEEAADEADWSDKGVSVFSILDESTGEIHRVPAREFVRGAVASEMPVSFHEEALKAQAVAAHTYAVYNHWQQQAYPDPALRGADFSADPANRKGYMTRETVLDFYGENGEQAWQQVCRAVDSVLPYIMEYDDEPIVAAYHAMSAGVTEDAGNVWVASVPYLQPAESEGDYLAPDYETDVHLSVEQVRGALLARYPAMELSGDASEWFEDLERSPSGYIIRARVGGVELHGSDIRAAFDLRSHNLDIAYSDTGFVFTSYGHGHGVGLSQYGADFLGRQGYSFEEILANYYTGVSLKRVIIEE